MKVILFVTLILSGMLSAGNETSEHTPVHSPIIEPKNEFEVSFVLEETAATPIVQAKETTAPKVEPTMVTTVPGEPTVAAVPSETAAEAMVPGEKATVATLPAETATVSTAPAVTAEPVQAAASAGDAEDEPILLRSVEELTLYDDRAAVIGKLGEPQGVTYDEFYSELVIYEYDRLKVVFFGEYIQSIDIAEDVKEVLLDDRYVPTTLADLREALGEPDYVAEDGIVFQRDEALLKLFLDEEGGEVSSISYYHLATV